MSMSIGVRRFSIDELSPDAKNALIIGVIIAKQPMNRFISKKDGLERGVWNFTLRDSPSDTINVTWWGSAAGALQCSQMFSISDVVEITNPKVVFIHPGDAGSKYRPTVSSLFALELHENKSEIIPHLEEDTLFIRELMRIPTKRPGDFLRLSDISSYGQAMRGQLVNLLVVVAQLSTVRTVNLRKDSSSALCRDLIVLDQSVRDFRITIWNEDILHWSDLWKPNETVLFMAEMRVDFNMYHKTATAAICSSTVITENPKIPETEVLRAYAKTVPAQPMALLDYLSNSVIDASKIDRIMTVGQLLDKAYVPDNPEKQFGAVLFATVTKFDIDGLDPVIYYKCVSCGQTQEVRGLCNTPECGSTEQNPIFNIRVDLTDHRGTVRNCRLSGSRAAEVIGCSEENFITKNIDWRTERKWRILLHRCEVRVIVLCATVDRPRPMFSIVTCSIADPVLVSAKLPIY